MVHRAGISNWEGGQIPKHDSLPGAQSKAQTECPCHEIILLLFKKHNFNGTVKTNNCYLPLQTSIYYKLFPDGIKGRYSRGHKRKR